MLSASSVAVSLSWDFVCVCVGELRGQVTHTHTHTVSVSRCVRMNLCWGEFSFTVTGSWSRSRARCSSELGVYPELVGLDRKWSADGVEVLGKVFSGGVSVAPGLRAVKPGAWDQRFFSRVRVWRHGLHVRRPATGDGRSLAHPAPHAEPHGHAHPKLRACALPRPR